MDQFIRVIETGYPLGGRLANVYIFCLPSAAMGRLDEILEQMRHTTLPGVEQFGGDEAGILIYTRQGVDNISTCLTTWEVIDGVLQTGMQIKSGYPDSFFFVSDYGTWEGATTYAELLRNPRFTLPYMKASASA